MAPLQSNVFYIDTQTNYLGSYVGFKVTNNTGAGQPALWMRLENFSGGQVRPAAATSTTSPVPLPTIAGGGTGSRYTYLKATAATPSATAYDVVVYNGRPGAGGTEICRETQTITSVQDVIKAAANKVTSASGPSSATLGGTFQLTVNGDTGTIGAGIASDPGVIRFSPAVAASWPSDSFRLIGVTHNAPLGGPLIPDVLSVSSMSGPAMPYTVTYTFRVVGPTSSPTPIVPVQNIASGTQVKHTDPGSLGSLPPIPVVTSTATVGVAAGGSGPYPAGSTVPLSITLHNAGSDLISLDEVRATLPSGWSAQAGTWKLDGTPISDPYDDGSGVLRLSGPASVPPNGTSALTFDATAGTAGTSGAFTAIGVLAGGQIDATTNPADDRPASKTLNVLGAPTAVDDTVSSATGAPRDINVLANDDTTGAAATVSVLSGPANGTATVVGGRIRYTSNASYTGTDTFTYEITTAGGTATATVTVTVSPPPAAPSPAPQTTVGTGTAKQHITEAIPPTGSITLLDAGQAATSITIPSQGTYTLDETTGQITFEPVLGFQGTATPVSFRLIDAYGQTGEATYTPTVNAPAAPNPTDRSSSGTGTATQQTTLTVPADDGVTLIDGGQATSVVTVPGEGRYTLDPASGVLTFTPQLGFQGIAGGVTYRVTDPYGQQGTATYRPTVDPPAAPHPSDEHSTGAGGAPQTAGPAIPDNGAITLLDGSNQAVTRLTVAGQGVYSLDTTTGVITFTPDVGYAGTPTPATFRVTDAYGQTAPALYRPSVTPPAGPAAGPLTSTGVGTTPHELSVIGTIELLDGNGNPVTSLTIPGEGTYAYNAVTGQLTFTPILGFAGTASGVTYRRTDAYGQTATGSYQPIVSAPAPPAAASITSSGTGMAPQHQSITAPAGGTITLLDAAGNATTTVTVPNEGRYTIDPSTGTITFQPVLGFHGPGTGVSYALTDAYGQRTVATYTPTTEAPALTPAAGQATTGQADQNQSTHITVPEGGAVTLIDADGTPTDRISIAGVGTYELDHTTSTIRFTPAAGFVGTAPGVRYRISDAYGQATDAQYTAVIAGNAPSPASRVCVSRRSMRIHWVVDGATPRWIHVTVNGKLRARLHGTARTATINMRGMPASYVKVVITAGRGKHVLKTTRSYRTCKTKQVGPPLRTLRLRTSKTRATGAVTRTGGRDASRRQLG